ncbi:TOMM precursor leader peptide-binding protein [Microscilla marina]|uniref:Adenylation/heterocyclization protein n=1 Tax=Microscilla marina ATCC 23134 TaxID=313606 RepID=A1ZGZ4_MICM2|nr:TOMM precursor leader peptide-binding protein [Microscilla marina]EAY30263.1 adenylation/heterocyclization protein [Microscilla marina ATCC 23134]
MKNQQLNPSYYFEVLNSDYTLLVSESNEVMFSNKLSNAILAEIAQNQPSKEELIAQFSASDVPLFEVMQVLVKLEQAGYIKEVSDFFTPEQAAYWESAGFNTTHLAQVLQQKTIGLISVGVAQEVFEDACCQAQLQLSATPDVYLVITKDYNHPELSQLNQQFEQSKTPWLLVKPTGQTLWWGPVFVPGKTACWQCLHHRLELHNPINKFYKNIKNTAQAPSKPLVSHPATFQMAASFAVLALVKWLYHQPTDASETQITSFNTQTLEKQHHAVVKRPQCNACGDVTIKSPQPITLQPVSVASTLGGYRAESPEVSFQKYKHHISPISGIISGLKPYGNTNHADIHNYSSGRNLALQSVSMFWLNHHLRSGNGGKGKTDIQAKMGAVGEAIERYSLMYQEGERYTIKAALQDLPEGIHPNQCMNYSKAQMQSRDTTNISSAKFYELIPVPFDASETMDWTPVYSLTNQKFKYLPACFCYAQYPAKDESQLYAYPDSNGCAAGNTIEEAILQGFMELVERDATAIWWYNRLKRPAVDLDTLDNPYIDKMRAYYTSINRSLWVLDITNDLGVPVFVAVSHCLKGNKEKILYAFGAHLEASIAVERAVIELNQLLPIGTSDKYLTQDQAFIDWLDTQTLTSNGYLLPKEGATKNIQTDYPRLCKPTIYDSVKYCIATARQQGLETLVLDLTQPDIVLPVVKVIVPGMRHFWRRTAPGRLYDVPVKMGWLSRPLAEEALNPISIFI